MTMEPQKGKKGRKGKGGRGAVGVKAEGQKVFGATKGICSREIQAPCQSPPQLSKKRLPLTDTRCRSGKMPPRPPAASLKHGACPFNGVCRWCDMARYK
jgi:hypothetical protein